MIDITDFVAKYQGMWVEVAGTSAPNQCVDLANLFIRDVLKLPMIEWTNAVDFPSKAGDKYLWIANTPTGVPEEGDLVIWSGTYGHIAIFMDGNTNDFHSFDQNYPVGSNCHIQYHNYTNVKGWLRCKNPPQPTVFCDPNWRVERDTNWNLYQTEKNKVLSLQTQLSQKDTQCKNKLTESINKIKVFLDTVI